MKKIGGVLISDEAWYARFACDLEQCRGECCHKGDLGALVSDDEVKKIEQNLDKLKPLLPQKHYDFLIKNGVSETFNDGTHIREIAYNHPCPLSFTNPNGVILCALHRYAELNKMQTTDIKPLWCALYPILLSKQGDYWVINCFFLKCCRSVKNPPFLLLHFGNVLSSIFGEKWFELLKKEYEAESLK